MATVVETSQPTKSGSIAPNLPRASLIGAVFVLASIAVAAFVIPSIWTDIATLSSSVMRFAAQIGVIAILGWFGWSMTGANPPKGLRGGIFLVTLTLIVILFIAQAIGIYADSRLGSSTAQTITIAVAVVLVGLSYRFFTSERCERLMISLDEQGWFTTKGYKRVLGQKVRRLTVLGILLLGGTGIYSLVFQRVLPDDWVVTLPFSGQTITLLSGAYYAIPIVLAALTFWIAFRIVNMPTFAEFLIATEAEMNKVSWSSRRSLIQDTIVVLVTTIFMAMFLLVVDLFWGTLLSSKIVGVLPPKSTEKQTNEIPQVKW